MICSLQSSAVKPERIDFRDDLSSQYAGSPKFNLEDLLQSSRGPEDKTFTFVSDNSDVMPEGETIETHNMSGHRRVFPEKSSQLRSTKKRLEKNLRKDGRIANKENEGTLSFNVQQKAGRY